MPARHAREDGLLSLLRKLRQPKTRLSCVQRTNCATCNSYRLFVALQAPLVHFSALLLS